jgi:iron complex transport system substrate-binding protein
VLLGSSFQGTWAVPSGRGFTAQLIHDAGGAYLWADTEYKGNMPLNVEQVVTKGLEADFWLNPGTAKSLDELKQSDERYANFRAFKEGRVFNQNRVLNAKGGNDFWETGLAYPEKILEDMVRIFHPELLPANGEFHWYRKLQ